MRNRALRPTLDGGRLEDRVVLSGARAALAALQNGNDNGFQRIPVLTTRAYWQATQRIEDIAEDFAEEYADAIDEAFDDNDEGQFNRDVDRDLRDFDRDLDRVARTIPFGRRNLLPQFRDSVNEVLEGGVAVLDGFRNGDDFDDHAFGEALAQELEFALREDLRTYVNDNALAGNNTDGSFVVLQSRDGRSTDREIPVVGRVGRFNPFTFFGGGSQSRRSGLAMARRG